jgi:hypothetical protein
MNASNSRSESNNRTANTVWTPSEAGMLAKTVKQQHGGRPTAAETIGTSLVNSKRETRNNKDARNSKG